MTLHQLRDSLLSSTKLETRKREVGNLIPQGRMKLDIIKMVKFLGSPPKNGFAVYNQLVQNNKPRLSISKINKAGACLRSHDSHLSESGAKDLDNNKNVVSMYCFT